MYSQFSQSPVRPTANQDSKQLAEKLTDYDKWTSPDAQNPTEVFIKTQIRTINNGLLKIIK